MAQDPRALAALAVRQGGVVSVSDAVACGFSSHAIRARVSAGQWHRLGSALAVIRSEPDLQEAWLLQIALGSKAAVSGPVAARLGGWDLPDPVRIALHPDHRRLEGVRVLRRCEPSVSTRPSGLRLAPRLDALADTLVVVGATRAESLIDLALQRRWIDAASFGRLVAERSGRGRTGARVLQRLLRRVTTGSRSEAEQRMGRLLRRSGTGPWVPNHPILDSLGRVLAEIDFALLHLRVAIEVDGRAYHSDRTSFERDRERQNLLVLDGWLVLRFTWEQITQHPEQVIAAIIRAVEWRSAGSDGRFIAS